MLRSDEFEFKHRSDEFEFKFKLEFSILCSDQTSLSSSTSCLIFRVQYFYRVYAEFKYFFQVEISSKLNFFRERVQGFLLNSSSNWNSAKKTSVQRVRVRSSAKS